MSNSSCEHTAIGKQINSLDTGRSGSDFFSKLNQFPILLIDWYLQILLSCPRVSALGLYSVFDFSSSPIANAIKNSSGLWDLKIL